MSTLPFKRTVSYTSPVQPATREFIVKRGVLTDVRARLFILLLVCTDSAARSNWLQCEHVYAFCSQSNARIACLCHPTAVRVEGGCLRNLAAGSRAFMQQDSRALRRVSSSIFSSGRECLGVCIRVDRPMHNSRRTLHSVRRCVNSEVNVKALAPLQIGVDSRSRLARQTALSGSAAHLGKT